MVSAAREPTGVILFGDSPSSSAQQIINSRLYTSIEDLLKVLGIGNVKLEKLREQVTVE